MIEVKLDGPTLSEILTDALEIEPVKQAGPKPRRGWLAKVVEGLASEEAAVLVRDLDFAMSEDIPADGVWH